LCTLLNAVLKGCVEGFTEFLPISSTGHLILLRDLLPLTENAPDVKRLDDLFDIVVQFPAVLAIVVLYRQRLWTAVRDLRLAHTVGADSRPFPNLDGIERTGANPWHRARRFWAGLLLAFLPAAVLGFLLHSRIEAGLMKPIPVALALAIGGVVLLLADRRQSPDRTARAEDTPLGRAFGIGLCQCLALLPGTSRSGATIVGARLLGLSRTAAAEYSFFLALPTMFGAFVYKLAKAWPEIQWATDGPVLAAGAVASFLTAWLVVALFIRYLQKHDLAVFGWYRIVLGGLVLLAG